ncbi:unnamed protein product, partial [Musa acuminata var. zebrina]
MQVQVICHTRVRCYCVRGSNPFSSTTSRCQARGPGVHLKGLPPLSVGRLQFTKVTLPFVFSNVSLVCVHLLPFGLLKIPPRFSDRLRLPFFGVGFLWFPITRAAMMMLLS